MNNQERAAIAEQVVDHYALVKVGEGANEDRESIIRDLISDLLHRAHQDGQDTDQILRCAKMNFEAEVADEEEIHAPS